MDAKLNGFTVYTHAFIQCTERLSKSMLFLKTTNIYNAYCYYFSDILTLKVLVTTIDALGHFETG